ncbi:hypothetical protein [Saliphagus infecundisoli]|uniref:Uncharacterized protein n=1 Tax=Saliphagus infecundisoli TaxID=1849069 RepID=A0ABD5QEE4_9EURY|nr:hypothetical protein [Saliphagus infecundisoli]
MVRRSRSRSRGGGGALSRRALLGGGVVAVGGAGLVARSGAFSQSTATREASIDSAGDDEALVGVAVASVVAGEDDQELATITNNAGRELSVTVTLADPEDGEVGEPAATIGPDDEHTFSVSVARGIDTGEKALPFDIEATGDDSFHATMERRADVEAGEEPGEPTLKRKIIDETKNTNAAFTIEYDVESVADFDRLELDVENASVGWIAGESFVRESPEGVLSYPSSGHDGGAEGHTYTFTFRVYDSNGVVLTRSTERVAGEESDDDDGIGGADDPELEWFAVEDDSSPQHGTTLAVEYQTAVADPDRFGSVRVEFDTDADPGGHWADETIYGEGSSDTVTHTRDGTVGSTYEVTVAVERPSGVTVDSGTVTIESGSNETIDWP